MAQIYTLNGRSVYDDRGQTFDAKTRQVVFTQPSQTAQPQTAQPQTAQPTQQVAQQQNLQQPQGGGQLLQTPIGSFQYNPSTRQYNPVQAAPGQEGKGVFAAQQPQLTEQKYQDPYEQYAAQRRAQNNYVPSRGEYYAQNPGGFQNFLQQIGLGQQPESPETARLRTQQQATLDRLIGLQGELEKYRQGSPELTELRKMIQQQQQALKDLTPAKFLQTQPGLRNVGITQGFLERRVAQERDPIASALQNLLSSESILSEEEERRRKAIQQQSELYQTQFGLQKELMGLQPKPYQLPEGVQSKLLENFLFPQDKQQRQQPTSIQEFEYAQQNPQFGEFLRTGKRDVEQQEFSNTIRQQQLAIQFQNAQTSMERAAIQSELNNMKLQQMLAGAATDAYGNPISLPKTAQDLLGKLDDSKVIADEILARIQEIDPSLFGPEARARGYWERAKAAVGLNPAVKTYEDFRKSVIGPLARAISGEVGVLTDRDIARAEGLLPKVGESREEVNRKLTQLYRLIQEKQNSVLSRYGAASAPGIGGGTKAAPKSGTTSSGIKYTIEE